MRYRFSSPVCLAAAALVVLSIGVGAAKPPQTSQSAASIDTAQTAKVFKEVQAVSDRDGGKMWGAPLYGATLFVDENTRALVANRPDYQNLLRPSGDVFVGSLPAEQNVANTSMRWGGVSWSMVKWPLPESAFERDKLVIHESFHRIQEQLGLGGPDTSNDHLDSKEGRLWLQLEWRALRAAMLGQKEARMKAEEDALLFRACRRSLFAEAAAHERDLEMVEGLPEYTGVALCAKTRADAFSYTATLLAEAPKFNTFVRSFAYVTGPAYGLLLDEAKPEWRKGLKAQDDLSALLSTAIGWAPPQDLKTAALTRSQVYGGKELAASEDARAAKKEKETAQLMKSFVEGAVFNLPLTEAFSYSFDPTGQVPLEGVGTVYPYLRISAAWGILEATQGGLLLKREDMISGIRVTAPKDIAARPLKGDGWTLTLKEGWAVVPGERKGDFELKRTALKAP